MTLNFGVGQSELPWGSAAATATPADVVRVCQEAAALGANSIRMSALWLQLDPNRNHNYQWGNLDRAIDAADTAGLDVLLIVEPRRSVLPIGVSATTSMATDYGRLCGAIATRYPGRIRWYEIGNEVNNLAFFGAPKTPSRYLSFLRAAFINITAADPGATVLAGALQAVGTGWPTLSPIEWVTKFYDSNPQEWFHGLSMHPYSTDGQFNPVAPTPDNKFAFKNIEAIRAIMDANGDSGKLIYCTEWGYDSMRTLDGLSTTTAELEAEQARNIQTHWNLLKPYADAGVIYPTTWVFMYRDWEQTNKKPQNHFGFTHFDYVKKPAWYFMRSLVVNQNITPPPAVLSVQGLAPGVVTDPSYVRSATGPLTVQGWEPVVETPIQPSAGGVSFQGYPPLVDALSPSVQWVSTGTADRDLPGGTSSATISMSATVTNVPGRVLLIPLVVSTSNLRQWWNYTPNLTSSLGGTFVRLGSGHIGSSSVLHGSVHIYGLYQPAVGAHTITASVYDAFTSFTALAGVPILVRGSSGFGAVKYATSASGTPRISIASMLDHLVLSVFGDRVQLTGLTNDVRHAAGSTVAGDGDWINVATAAGAATVMFEDVSVGAQVFAALELDLPNITGSQKFVDPPQAALTMQGWAPEVAGRGMLTPPTGTLSVQGWAPIVGRPVNPPAGGLSVRGWVPAVHAAGVIEPPAATISVQGWAPTVEVPAVEFIDVAAWESARTETIGMPTHQAGDLLLMFAYNSNLNTLPTLPSGWTGLATATQSGSAAARVAYKFAASSSEPSGNWGSVTNALVCHSYRGVGSVGAVATAHNNNASVLIPALTLQQPDGSSWVVGMAAISNATGGNLNTAPSGMTRRVSTVTNTDCDTAGYDTNSGVTAWTGHTTNHTVGAAWIGAAVELKV